MAQFDVVENLNVLTRSRYPYSVVLQHDRIEGLRTIVVAPMVEAPLPPLDRLQPVLSVENRNYQILIQALAAVDRGMLGRKIGSLEADRYVLVAALDLLFTGI